MAVLEVSSLGAMEAVDVDGNTQTIPRPDQMIPLDAHLPSRVGAICMRRIGPLSPGTKNPTSPEVWGLALSSPRRLAKIRVNDRMRAPVSGCWVVF